MPCSFLGHGCPDINSCWMCESDDKGDDMDVAMNAIVLLEGFGSLSEFKCYLEDGGKPVAKMFVAVGKNCDTGLLLSRSK